MQNMTIGEVARHADIRPSTIRYYEAIGLLPPPTRAGGRRQYDTVVLDQLAVIRLAREAGFTLREAKGLLQGFTPVGSPSVRWRPWAMQKREEIQALIERGRRMHHILETLLACECRQIEDCGRIARGYSGHEHPRL